MKNFIKKVVKKFQPVEFDPRKNSLNFIRLILAASVIVAHAYILGGYAPDPVFGVTTIGGWAVTGFFCISGYLIMSSRLHNNLSKYLGKRIARILPAYIVCILLIVVFFAPLAHILNTGSLQGYLSTAPTPADFLLKNLNLGMWVGQWSIGDTLANTPMAGTWNGPIYTLFYEFSCYLIVGVMAIWAVFRKPKAVGALWLITSFLAIHIDRMVGMTSFDPVTGHSVFVLMLRFVPLFLGGALVYLLKDSLLKKLKFSGVLISIATIIFVNKVPGFAEYSVGILSPFITYILLWLSTAFPLGKLGQLTSKHDISYGIYIYGWVIQQIIMVFVINGLVAKPPMWLYIILSFIGTAIFAILSWRFIEKPVLTKAKRSVEG
jgi:peptidoglycan/LPS O-acetylase OafA/YrhL